MDNPKCLDGVPGGLRIRLCRARDKPVHPVDSCDGDLFGLDGFLVLTVCGFFLLFCFAVDGLSEFSTIFFDTALGVAFAVEKLSGGLEVAFVTHVRAVLYSPRPA